MMYYIRYITFICCIMLIGVFSGKAYADLLELAIINSNKVQITSIDSKGYSYYYTLDLANENNEIKISKLKNEIPKKSLPIKENTKISLIKKQENLTKWNNLIELIDEPLKQKLEIFKEERTVYALTISKPMGYNNPENTIKTVLFFSLFEDVKGAYYHITEQPITKQPIVKVKAKIFQHYMLNYEPDEKQLTKEQNKKLKEIIAFLENQSSNINIHVMGFTDKGGGAEKNYKLSKNRVNECINYLKNNVNSYLNITYHPYYFGDILSEKRDSLLERRVEIIVSHKENGQNIDFIKMYQDRYKDSSKYRKFKNLFGKQLI